MKKIFLFLAAASLSLASCSSDDGGSSNGGDSVTFKVNGVEKTFNTVQVEEVVWDEGTPDEFSQIEVTASMNNSPTEFVTFSVEPDGVGADALYDFRYTAAGDQFYSYDSFVSIVQTNTGSKLRGTFSGTLNSGGEATKTITEGEFNISY